MKKKFQVRLGQGKRYDDETFRGKGKTGKSRWLLMIVVEDGKDEKGW